MALFLADAKDRMGLSSNNMAYTAVEGVFRVFRRRLTPQQALDFAQVLPAVPRAVFVSDWVLGEGPVPFADRATLVAEAKALRPNHNLTPDSAIEATAYALRRATDARAFERVLARMPQGAEAFWAVPGVPPEALAQRIV